MHNTYHAETIITARKRSLGQGYIFRSTCQEFCSQGRVVVVSQYALQVVSQHALQVSGGGLLSQHALQVYRPTSEGEVEGSGLGGVSRPTPMGGGKLRGLAWGVCRPTPRGGLQAHTWGGESPGPHPGGVSQHALRQTPQQMAPAVGGMHPTGMRSPPPH